MYAHFRNLFLKFVFVSETLSHASWNLLKPRLTLSKSICDFLAWIPRHSGLPLEQPTTSCGETICVYENRSQLVAEHNDFTIIIIISRYIHIYTESLRAKQNLLKTSGVKVLCEFSFVDVLRVILIFKFFNLDWHGDIQCSDSCSHHKIWPIIKVQQYASFQSRLCPLRWCKLWFWRQASIWKYLCPTTKAVDTINIYVYVSYVSSCVKCLLWFVHCVQSNTLSSAP